MNRLLSGIVALSFLSFAEAITPQGTFFFFAGMAAISFCFVRRVVPETKGKSLEEIEMMFEQTGGEIEVIGHSQVILSLILIDGGIGTQLNNLTC